MEAQQVIRRHCVEADCNRLADDTRGVLRFADGRCTECHHRVDPDCHHRIVWYPANAERERDKARVRQAGRRAAGLAEADRPRYFTPPTDEDAAA